MAPSDLSQRRRTRFRQGQPMSELARRLNRRAAAMETGDWRQRKDAALLREAAAALDSLEQDKAALEAKWLAAESEAQDSVHGTLVELLRKAEWAGIGWGWSSRALGVVDGFAFRGADWLSPHTRCLYCGGHPSEGHKPDCRLAQALSVVQEEEK